MNSCHRLLSRINAELKASVKILKDQEKRKLNRQALPMPWKCAWSQTKSAVTDLTTMLFVAIPGDMTKF